MSDDPLEHPVPVETGVPEPATNAADHKPTVLARVLSLFWNREERRVRALWRILVLLALMAGLGVAYRATGLYPERGTPTYFLVITASRLVIALVTVWLVGRFLDRRPLGDLGLAFSRDWFADLAFGLALGAGLMTGVFLAQWGLDWLSVSGAWRTTVPGMPFWQAFLTPLVIFVGVGIVEELIARGYLLRNIAEGLAFRRLGGARGGLIVAVVISSALFALGHVGNPNANWVSTVNIALAGVLLALGFVLTGQLALPIGLHITWNLFQASVFGFPVSGVTRLRTSVLATEETGPDLWTGGAFGPEAGLVGLGAMLVGAGLIVAWVRWRHGTSRLVTALAQPPRRPSRDEAASPRESTADH